MAVAPRQTNIRNGTITTMKVKKDPISTSGSIFSRTCQTIQTIATVKYSGARQRRISKETVSKATPVIH
jgi:hypothetical protein